MPFKIVPFVRFNRSRKHGEYWTSFCILFCFCRWECFAHTRFFSVWRKPHTLKNYSRLIKKQGVFQLNPQSNTTNNAQHRFAGHRETTTKPLQGRGQSQVTKSLKKRAHSFLKQLSNCRQVLRGFDVFVHFFFVGSC